MANSSSVALGPQPAGFGNRHIYIVSMSIDTYADGGVAVPVPASITQPIVFVQASGGYVAEWVASTGKVKLYTTAGTQATTLASAVKVDLMFIGQ